MPYREALATLGDHLHQRIRERGLLLQQDAVDRLGVNTWTLAIPRAYNAARVETGLTFSEAAPGFPGRFRKQD